MKIRTKSYHPRSPKISRITRPKKIIPSSLKYASTKGQRKNLESLVKAMPEEKKKKARECYKTYRCPSYKTITI